MQLKDYQTRTLKTLQEFFRACLRFGKPHLAYADVSIERFGLSVPYLPAPELPNVPYVCLRLPTGGGKTLVAAHSIAVAKTEFLHTDEPLVLWLVPSNAIREQTLKALRNRKHPYRKAVEAAGANVTVLDIAEALSVQPSQLNGVTIIVSTMQAFRVEETEGRKVYEQNGSLMGHFPASLQPSLLAGLEKLEDGSPLRSLANVIALHRPLVIVDEAHNARTDLSFATLKRFAPSAILEFTATPDTEDYPSNVLHTVSAAELKAEGMIKLPVVLETQQDWRVAISQAIAKRNELESIARAERKDSGEYLRPIVLLQAQPTYKNKTSVNVEAVKTCLLKDNQIPEDQIAVATGDNNEISEIDLFAPECPIRYIVTVQALREGWDCSFAYILCTVAEQVSATAVEQILGRVLRQPNAKAKKHSELNRAYAFAASLHFANTANNLADALIQNGFEKQEVQGLIQAAKQQQLLDSGYWFGQDEAAAATDASTPARIASPSLQSTPFSIPKLAVNMGDFLEQFDDSFFDEKSLDLAKQDPYLSEEEFPKDAPTNISVELDIDEQGKISSNFLTDLHQQNFLLSSDQKISKEVLARWLDQNIPHRDVPHEESHIFFLGMVERLLEKRRWTLGELWREKYRLKESARKKINNIRNSVRSAVFQKTLFSTAEYELVSSPDLVFTFDPEEYPHPPNSLFAGRHKFKKHYYKVVGDMKAEGEEFQCAQLLDIHPNVKRWVRNLEGRPQHSFWLQTSTDRFYPDFVCELMDNRFLVVEYKGLDRWSDDDSKEKRAIGQVWEEKSDGQCLFIMPKGPDWNAVLAKLGE
ncbi:MAG: DEAD/DEAH box helicase family protein [Anaerolineales bacterium]|nr:DEAD/DEAH box helicase family protein [Anaerolineales bacterium]